MNMNVTLEARIKLSEQFYDEPIFLVVERDQDGNWHFEFVDQEGAAGVQDSIVSEDLAGVIDALRWLESRFDIEYREKFKD